MQNTSIFAGGGSGGGGGGGAVLAGEETGSGLRDFNYRPPPSSQLLLLLRLTHFCSIRDPLGSFAIEMIRELTSRAASVGVLRKREKIFFSAGQFSVARTPSLLTMRPTVEKSYVSEKRGEFRPFRH